MIAAIAGGMMARRPAAEMSHQRGSIWALQAVMMSGSVCASLNVSISANRKSFQMKKNERRYAAASPGLASGRMTRTICWTFP